MRIILCVISAALLIGMAYHALSAPNPNLETTLTATQTSKEAISAPSRCLQATTIQRFSVKPDGKMEYLGGFTMWTACEK